MWQPPSCSRQATDACLHSQVQLRKGLHGAAGPVSGREPWCLTWWGLQAREFNFEKLGIGGLDKQFEQIFRRAFASRVLPPGVVERLGIHHVKGVLLHGPPGTGAPARSPASAKAQAGCVHGPCRALLQLPSSRSSLLCLQRCSSLPELLALLYAFAHSGAAPVCKARLNTAGELPGRRLVWRAGKTLIARQIGKMLNGREPKVVNGPEVLNKYVGASEENIRKLFADAEAEQAARGDASDLHVIIFDEIDAICKSRGSVQCAASTPAGTLSRHTHACASADKRRRQPVSVTASVAAAPAPAPAGEGTPRVGPACRSGTGVNDSVVNQLLTKIDGVDALNNILLIGMTNRKDMLDEALMRPGRLEVQIEIGLPDGAGREQILKVGLRPARQVAGADLLPSLLACCRAACRMELLDAEAVHACRSTPAGWRPTPSWPQTWTCSSWRVRPCLQPRAKPGVWSLAWFWRLCWTPALSRQPPLCACQLRAADATPGIAACVTRGAMRRQHEEFQRGRDRGPGQERHLLCAEPPGGRERPVQAHRRGQSQGAALRCASTAALAAGR